MKNRSFLINIVCSALITGIIAGSFSVNVGAVSRKSTKSEEEVTTTTETTTETTTTGSEITSEESTSKSSKSSKSSSSKSSTPQVDEKGNTILMTQSQRRKKFASKTNPKRDEKVVTTVYKPNFNGFTYADFNTCNSYNSENGLGGHPIYLVGTITDIEKVYENTSYYGTAILVNDMDGFQWYMRAEIAKDKYDLFRNSFLGKAGYIYGIYSGYSGVTNRPMMDITVVTPIGGVPVDMKLYQ